MALAFTDARGRMVFADSNLLRLLGYSQCGPLVGRPAAEVLRIDRTLIARLLEEVTRSGAASYVIVALGVHMQARLQRVA